MSNKKYCSASELHTKIMLGVSKLSENVSTTLGPKGRNVIIKNKDQSPVVTKDGVTVARNVSFSDPFEDLGAQLVKQVTSQTNAEAGDGTSTSTVLTESLLSLGFAALENSHNVSQMKDGMSAACNQAVDLLKSYSIPMRTVSDMEHIAYISSNGDDEITSVITKAATSVGKGGSITIEEGRSNKTSLEFLEGFKIDAGFAAAAFVTDERLNLCKYEEPIFLLTDARIETVDQILPSLEIAAREARPLVIIADEIEGQALAALIMNTIRGSMKVVAIKAPRYGEERRSIMKDLATSLGAKYFSQLAGSSLSSSEVSINDFGSARSVVINKGQTIITGGAGKADEISFRIEGLDQQISEETSEAELRILLERKSRLSSGVAVIKVGASTEVEMIEKKHRIEDALEAVRSAQQEGYVPGGGLTLFSISSQLNCAEPLTDSYIAGFEIVREALQGPVIALAKNSQLEHEDLVKKFNFNHEKSQYVGYDFRTDEYVDMLDAGVIDPVKVVRCALENAVSVASTLLTTNAAIVEE